MNYQFFIRESSSKYWILAFFLIGIILRLLFINSLRLDYDEGLFLFIGNMYSGTNIFEGISNNFIYFFADVPLNQPPIVSIVYSLLFTFFPLDYSYGRILNVIIGAFCIIIIYLIVKNIWNYKIGLLASLIITIDPTIAMGVLMNMDAITWFFFSLSLYGIVKSIKTDTYFWHTVTGVFFGLSMLTKWTLAIVPISYVFLYIYYNMKLRKIPYSDYINKIILTSLVAFAVFLPWVVLLVFFGRFDILFMHISRFTPFSGLNSIFQLWSISPFILIFIIYSFLNHYKNNKNYRVPLLYGLIVIFPFYLLMPRYYDFSPFLILCVIILSKPLFELIENSFSLITDLKSNGFHFDKITLDPNKLLILTLTFVMISANIGMIFQEAIFDKDQTVQKTISWIDDNAPNNATIISLPEFSVYSSDKIYIHSYNATIGHNFFLIFSINNLQTSSAILEGVNSGFTEINGIIYNFQPLTRINDVTIYQIIAT